MFIKRIIVKTVLALIFSMLLSSPSYAEWTKVLSIPSITYYVDFESIREHNGYIYYWELEDMSHDTNWKIKSYISYRQVDCAVMGYKILKDTKYNHHMGEGDSVDSSSYSVETAKWHYPRPSSPGEQISTVVCDSVR